MIAPDYSRRLTGRRFGVSDHNESRDIYAISYKTGIEGDGTLHLRNPEITAEMLGRTFLEFSSEISRVVAEHPFSWLEAPHHATFYLGSRLPTPDTDTVTVSVRPSTRYWATNKQFKEYCDEFGLRAKKIKTLACNLSYSSFSSNFEIEVKLSEEQIFYRVTDATLGEFLSTVEARLISIHREALASIENRPVTGAGEAISDEAEESFFRLYVPDAKFDAEQTGSLVRLFESYMRNVEGKPVQVDAQRTGKGMLYSFRNDGASVEAAQEDLPGAVNRFEQFLTLCKNKPDNAADFVKSLGVRSDNALPLVWKYSTQYTRLQMDYRHERERLEMKARSLYEERRLGIQQQFEAEAVELSPSWPALFNAIPNMTLGSSLLPNDDTTATLTIIGNQANSDMILQAAVSQVTGLENGLSPSELELLQTIKEKSKNSVEAISLKSDLQTVSDTSAQTTLRKKALRSIGKFFADNNEIVDETAFRTPLGDLSRPSTD